MAVKVRMAAIAFTVMFFFSFHFSGVLDFFDESLVVFFRGADSIMKLIRW
jgi:hypothetical protein